MAILDRRRVVDLLLTEHPLAGPLDGWSVAEHARLRLAALPVIYVTGYSSEPARKVSGSILIMKPYRPSAVIKAAHALGVRTGS